jgi:hypothetical protein
MIDEKFKQRYDGVELGMGFNPFRKKNDKPNGFSQNDIEII